MANKFYTIVNLNKYKEKFVNGNHKNDNESTIDLINIFSDTGGTNIKSNNNPDNEPPKGFFIQDQQENKYMFELKGNTPQQNQIPNSVGSFAANNNTIIQESIKNANNVGFGLGNPKENTYQEFGDQIMPGNQSNIQEIDSFSFVRGIRGAQGGSGGGGGGRTHASRKKGGGGGSSGGSYSAWVYPKTDINSKNVEFGNKQVGQGGHAGNEGEWGVYSGEDGGGGGKGGDTLFNFFVDNDNSTENSFTIDIEGSNGGAGGEKGRYNENGNSGQGSGNGPAPTMGEGSYGFITSSSVSTPKQGAGRAQYGQDGRDGQKGNNGTITDIYYLAGSRGSHMMDSL